MEVREVWVCRLLSRERERKGQKSRNALYGWSISLQISAVTEDFISAPVPNSLLLSRTKPHCIRAQTSCRDQRHSPGCSGEKLTPFSSTEIIGLLLWLRRVAFQCDICRICQCFQPRFSFPGILGPTKQPPVCVTAFPLQRHQNMCILHYLTKQAFTPPERLV